MAHRLGLVLMAGVEPRPGPAVALVQRARLAAALDALAAAAATGVFHRLIVVTNDQGWAGDLPAPTEMDIDIPDHPFHFGRRLAEVVRRHELTHVLYLGAGAAPLMGAADWAAVGEKLLAAEQTVLTNNLHSTDWAAFCPAGVLLSYADRVNRDNALAWVLHREAGLPAGSLPATAASRLDIDTPADLLVLARHPGCGDRLAAELGRQGLDTERLDRAMAVLRAEGKHLIVAGRVGSSTWAQLEQRTLCWVRLLAEERGMVASGRQARGEVRSLLGAYRDQVGTEGLFHTLESWSDAVFWDNRVLLAHSGAWPPAEDRFSSDLGWTDRVQDPLLRELTSAAAATSIPVVMGGQSLVSGGLLALLETLPCQ